MSIATEVDSNPGPGVDPSLDQTSAERLVIAEVPETHSRDRIIHGFAGLSAKAEEPRPKRAGAVGFEILPDFVDPNSNV